MNKVKVNRLGDITMSKIDMEVVSRIHQDFLQFNKYRNPIRKKMKDINKHFTEK